jgi:hypothetical protein
MELNQQPQQPQQPQQQPVETGVGQPDSLARIWDAADESRMDKMGETLDRLIQKKREREAAQEQPAQQAQPPQQPPQG